MKKYFITGMIILLPLAVTVGLVAFIVRLLTNPFVGWVTNFLELHRIQPRKVFLFKPRTGHFIFGPSINSCFVVFFHPFSGNDHPLVLHKIDD